MENSQNKPLHKSPATEDLRRLLSLFNNEDDKEIAENKKCQEEDEWVKVGEELERELKEKWVKVEIPRIPDLPTPIESQQIPQEVGC